MDSGKKSPARKRKRDSPDLYISDKTPKRRGTSSKAKKKTTEAISPRPQSRNFNRNTGSRSGKNKSGQKAQKPKKDSTDGQKNTGLPFSGETFVITGELQYYSREDLTEKLKKLGARVTGSVSSKTTYLIHGEKLEDGRHYTEGNKYIKAKDLGTKVMSEEEIEDKLRSLEDSKPIAIEDADTEILEMVEEVYGPLPWTEKYQPKSFKDLVGNSQTVEKLKNWLADWEDVVLFNRKKDVKTIRYGRFDPQSNLNARAVLLSGTPGIGKTSAARLVAKDLGYHITEMNASDVRSRKVILDPLRGISLSKSLTAKGEIVKNLVIMDEVDGMSAGDRGGVGAINEIIKKTSIPIICICNDRNNLKLKSLANNCLDIRFKEPHKSQIAKRLLTICAKESLNIKQEDLLRMIEVSGNDIRQSLNMLEMWSRTDKSLTAIESSDIQRMSKKDTITSISNFDAASNLLSSVKMKNLPFRNKLDLFFIDSDLIPLLIYENYTIAILNNKKSTTSMTQAIDAIAFSDVLNKKIRSDGHWSLLPAYGQFSSIEPGFYSGNGIPFPRFPEWFGRNSSQNKNNRLLREIKNALGHRISGDNDSVINDYIPMIYQLAMNPLKTETSEGAKEAADLLYEYRLSPDFLKEHIVSLQLNSEELEEEYKDLPPGIKKALTVSFNQNYSSSIARNKKKKRVSSIESAELAFGEFAEQESQEKSESEDEYVVSAKKVRKKKKGK